MRGKRLQRALEASSLSAADLGAKVGVSVRYINQLISDDRQGKFELWDAIAGALGVSVATFSDHAALPLVSEEPRAGHGTLLIPIDAELNDKGYFSGETTTVVHGPKGLWRKGPTPNYPLVRVEGAGERWFACKMVTTAPLNFRAGRGEGAISIDLYPGDLLIMAQADDVPPPRDGALVHAVRGVGEESSLRVYRDLDGIAYLWPLAPEHGDPVQHRDPWKVAEVAVELRRKL